MPLAARFLVVALTLMAATCGQKGPLTPPDQSGLNTAPSISETAVARVPGGTEAVTIEAARSV